MSIDIYLQVFCRDCASQTTILAYNRQMPQRVCDVCFMHLNDEQNSPCSDVSMSSLQPTQANTNNTVLILVMLTSNAKQFGVCDVRLTSLICFKRRVSIQIIFFVCRQVFLIVKVNSRNQSHRQRSTVCNSVLPP
jgi:hypothetical protein